MKKPSYSDFLASFMSELKTRDALPKNIELSRLGPLYLASIFNELESEIITESVFTGMDTNPDLAVLKGLVEMVERHAFATGNKMGLRSCLTQRSDGFAAFPVGPNIDSKNLARENAYYEAIERFVWASWWDDKTISHESTKIQTGHKTLLSENLLLELTGIVPVRSIVKVTPNLKNADVVVLVYFAFLEPYGVISGGAAGSRSDLDRTSFRAICELLRHALAIRKIQKTGAKPSTFYERRLAHFGLSKAGSDATINRLNATGTSQILLPPLAIDERVLHRFSEIVEVHRCFFKGQPPFVGGDLERLCL